MLKLSEAMRLGAMMKPQARFALRKYEGNEVIATCALGAALDAVGRHIGSGFPDEWGIILHKIVPDQTQSLATVNRVICNSNDHYCWTREQIADWVESIEREMEAETPAEVRKLVEV